MLHDEGLRLSTKQYVIDLADTAVDCFVDNHIFACIEDWQGRQHRWGNPKKPCNLVAERKKLHVSFLLLTERERERGWQDYDSGRRKVPTEEDNLILYKFSVLSNLDPHTLSYTATPAH